MDALRYLSRVRFDIRRGQGMDVYQNPEIGTGSVAVSSGGGYSKALNVFIAAVKDS